MKISKTGFVLGLALAAFVGSLPLTATTETDSTPSALAVDAITCATPPETPVKKEKTEKKKEKTEKKKKAAKEKKAKAKQKSEAAKQNKSQT